MARTKRQYENEIRTVIVGKVGTELRKAKFVTRVINKAVSNNQVVTGGLINPERTGSITPSSDDKWLIDKDSVDVKVDSVDSATGLPLTVRIAVEIDYGLKFNYIWLSRESKVKNWKPNGYAIQDWVERKMSKGYPFYIMNPRGGKRPARQGDAGDRNRVSYMIFRRLSDNGINKTDLTDPFMEGNSNVDKTLQRGFDKALDRIAELYDQYIDDAFATATFDII